MNETPPADAGPSPESVEYETVRNGVLVVGAAGAQTAIELVEQGVDPDDVLVIESAATATPTRPGRAGIDGALGTLRSRATDLSVGDRPSRSYEFALNLGFALLVADAILRGARERTESRGAHYRTDHPDTDPDWRRNVRYRRDSVGAGRLSTTPVGTPSEAVQAVLDAGHELDYHQLE